MEGELGHLGGTPEWLPGGQDLRDVALQLRLMLNGGTSFALTDLYRQDHSGHSLRATSGPVMRRSSGIVAAITPSESTMPAAVMT